MNTWEIEASALARFYIYEFSDNFKVFLQLARISHTVPLGARDLVGLGGRL